VTSAASHRTRASVLRGIEEEYWAVGIEGVDADTAVAFHEAGHAWAYERSGLRVRYATLRPRAAGAVGRVVGVRRTVAAHEISVPALGGPLAESMYIDGALQADLPVHPDDLLQYALDLGGGGPHGDAEKIGRGILDLTEFVAAVRAQMHEEWQGITNLAERLVTAGTVRGPEARELLRRR
jgi:hypothetical protein